MIRIVDTGKYYSCLSCGKAVHELLRTFEIGKEDTWRNSLTLCTECLGELVRKEMLYQPKEIAE